MHIHVHKLSMVGFNQTEILGRYYSIVPSVSAKGLSNPNNDVVMTASLLGQCQLCEEPEVGGERLVMATERSSDRGVLRQRDRMVQTNGCNNSVVRFCLELWNVERAQNLWRKLLPQVGVLKFLCLLQYFRHSPLTSAKASPEHSRSPAWSLTSSWTQECVCVYN